MFRIIKSELMKWFSGKMVYISTILTVILSTIGYIVTKILIKYNPEAMSDAAKSFVTMSGQEYIVNSLVNLISGGAIFIIVTIITATIISEDYGRGTLKYSLLATTKEKIIISKICTIGIINLTLMSAALVSSCTIGIIGYQWRIGSHSIFQILALYMLAWLTLSAFSCLIVFAISSISKMSGAIGLGIGIYMIIGILGVIVPDSVKSFIVTVDFPKIIDMSMETWGQILLTNVIYILIFSILSVALYRKKEILF